MIQTFTFGYLPKKWKRLIRASSLTLWIIYLFCLDPFYGGLEEPIAWLPLILIPIISWTLKPFVVKDKS